MAGSALAVRARFGVWGMKVLQTRGFVSDSDSAQGEKTKEQLAALRKHHEDEIDHHSKEIERLQKQIERHKKKIQQLKNNH